MLGVSSLQDLDGIPDRQAVERLPDHAGWNFALNRQLGDPVFHPTRLVNFRQRLIEHEQSGLGFKTLLKRLRKAGWVSRQSRQRLDSTARFGRVALQQCLGKDQRHRTVGVGEHHTALQARRREQQTQEFKQRLYTQIEGQTL
jgi:hypothetical protein